jgi:hypothetical protein
VILAEDREKSMPVICANEDFFQHVPDWKSADKTRLEERQFRPILDFHSSFHKIFMPKVLLQTCE